MLMVSPHADCRGISNRELQNGECVRNVVDYSKARLRSSSSRARRARQETAKFDSVCASCVDTRLSVVLFNWDEVLRNRGARVLRRRECLPLAVRRRGAALYCEWSAALRNRR